MRILFTKTEGSFWNPLHLHSIDRPGLLSLLTDGVGDIPVKRSRNHTILKGVMVSDTLKPDSIREEDIKFHSLMIETGTIFDTYFYFIHRNSGLDYCNFQYRNFGLPAKRFEELWKDMTEKAHEAWIDKRIKEKIDKALRKKKK
jgi:hypothetical protein